MAATPRVIWLRACVRKVSAQTTEIVCVCVCVWVGGCVRACVRACGGGGVSCLFLILS